MEDLPKVERKKLMSCQRFDVEEISYPLPAGGTFRREVIRHPGAVVILPILSDGRICLIRNYRATVEQTLYELPAGTREPGEPPIETARRELAEETGYQCSSIEPLLDFHMSPGILDEHMFAFLATDLTPGPQRLELGEQIANCPVSVAELDEMLRSGQLSDSKSISVLLYYLRFGKQ
ncbi:MAG: NUDIX hydrolase [Aureliella sp.]